MAAHYKGAKSAKLAFEKTKFYGRYLDNSDLEAFERFQNAQPQFAEDGTMVFAGAPEADIRARRRTSAAKWPAAASQQAAHGTVPESSTTSAPASTIHRSGIHAIGHPLHARLEAKVNEGASEAATGAHRRTPAIKRPAAQLASSETTSSTSTSSASSSTIHRSGIHAIGHPRHAHLAAKRAKGTFE
jgi:hypothetical protein